MFGYRLVIDTPFWTLFMEFVQKIPVTPSSEAILLLDDRILSEIDCHRQNGDVTKEIEGSGRERKE